MYVYEYDNKTYILLRELFQNEISFIFFSAVMSYSENVTKHTCQLLLLHTIIRLLYTYTLYYVSLMRFRY